MTHAVSVASKDVDLFFLGGQDRSHSESGIGFLTKKKKITHRHCLKTLVSYCLDKEHGRSQKAKHILRGLLMILSSIIIRALGLVVNGSRPAGVPGCRSLDPVVLLLLRKKM